jgi:hypothetical protein
MRKDWVRQQNYTDRERRADMHTYVYVKDWGCSRVIIQWNHTVETVIA